MTAPTESIEYILGQMDGRLDGIGREIKSIKELMKCKSEDCVECKNGIDTKIDGLSAKVSTIENGCNTGTAVAVAKERWIDTLWGRIAISAGVILSILAMIVSVIY